MERLYFVEPNESYKEQAIEYIEEHNKYNSKINGCGGLYKYVDNYEEWLMKLKSEKERDGRDGRVPGETYMLIRESDNHLIGMCNIRVMLNERLKECGGNIGYGIRPTERRKGYNKINLYLALIRCQELGLDVVLLDSNDDNIASWKTMEALGGVLIKKYVDSEKGLCRKYSIDVNAAINNYREIYEEKILRR